MPLPSPNLDDRNFVQLVEEARQRIRQSCPDWTDLSPGDPGMVLLELFAHLTEVMIYRLNRLPEKAYIEFLRLIGVSLHPPAAASVRLRFTLNQAQDSPVEIPQATRITTARSNGGALPLFTTSRTVTIPGGQTEAEVLAFQCEAIEAELAGVGTGLAGLSIAARWPPIIAPTIDGLDLLVGVEAAPGELGERARAIKHDGKSYRIWREVDSFTNLGSDKFVYVADRMTGLITFAPAVQMRLEDGHLSPTSQALAEVPTAGREIRLWYRQGGGPEGNLAANTLTVLKDVVPGIQVTNPNAATGGRGSETLQNALVRGPQELHSLERAVTATDFELIAQKFGAVARAKAFTRASLWAHASPGTVEVLIVPYISEAELGGASPTATKLAELETDEAQSQIRKAIDDRRPLGTTCLVNWVSYKTVRVDAQVVIHRGEDPVSVKRRVIERLRQTINPLPTPINPTGWQFGRPLRASHIYDIILTEPGVSYINQVRLMVDEVPDENVSALTADAFQPRTWYATTGGVLYRSMNNGNGWEPARRFPDHEIDALRTHPRVPGLLAVAARSVDDSGLAQIYISSDCGENWSEIAEMALRVEDMAWTVKEGLPVLLLATDVGLYELAIQPGSSPLQLLVDPQNQDLGFYAITVSPHVRGTINVAVAARGSGGVFLSKQGGKSNTFSKIGLDGENARVLEVQKEGVRYFLWAGIATPGNEGGKGCVRRELLGEEDPPDGWRSFHKNWSGGSCRGLAFQGAKAFAATHRSGVVCLDLDKSDAGWESTSIDCGLPMRDTERLFHPINAVAVGGQDSLIMTAGPKGVYRSEDAGGSYESCSTKIFTEKVSLPETWLFCSGEHNIIVVSEDEKERD